MHSVEIPKSSKAVQKSAAILNTAVSNFASEASDDDAAEDSEYYFASESAVKHSDPASKKSPSNVMVTKAAQSL